MKVLITLKDVMLEDEEGNKTIPSVNIAVGAAEGAFADPSRGQKPTMAENLAANVLSLLKEAVNWASHELQVEESGMSYEEKMDSLDKQEEKSNNQKK